jgi:2',3'-cyclic-nucleotide 2'-phosphodiesterase (5'-nucleotidase family)
MKILYTYLYPIIFVLLLSLLSCGTKKRLVPIYQMADYAVLVTDTTDTILSKELTFLKTYKAAMEEKMNVRIGYTKEVLKKEKPNSTLGNMVSDAMLWQAKKLDKNVQIAIANFGGIRIPYLPAGDISLGKVYEIMPFDNALCTVHISGALVDSLCQHMARAGGWPVSDMQFTLVKEKATDIEVQGKPLDYKQQYLVALNDYMANGGDHCDFLVPVTKKLTGVLVRDAIIDYVKNADSLGLSLIVEPVKRIQ